MKDLREYKQEELPSQGEIVVCRIVRVLDYGAFAELLEYDDVQGFIHLSQVATSWVKNIRNHVRENQLRAAEVLKIDLRKNQIDMSLAKVNKNAQRVKIEEYKKNKRAQKLMEVLANNTGEKFEKAWQEVAEPLMEQYGGLFKALQEVRAKGIEAAGFLPKEWKTPLKELVDQNIEQTEKEAKGAIKITIPGPEGVSLIKKALTDVRDSRKDSKVEIYYAGTSSYIVKAKSFDPKIAEKTLKQVLNDITVKVKAFGGSAE